jgi:Na+-translocating ferredoxin:NAD+ oxidoreductase RnfC subunit
MEIKELISIVKEHGVIGAGGAGFPTYAKLDQRVDTIILNCAECEPLLKVHRQLLQKHAYEIMETLALVTDALKVDKAYIAVKEAYTKTVEAVQANLASFPKLELKCLPEVYPMGDEVILIYETTGKVVAPGSIPIEVGVAVFNAETLWNIHNAVQNKKPVSTKCFSIVGDVKKPVTVETPIGMTVEDAVDLAGGPSITDPAYIMGGPMTGNLVNPYDTVTKTTNAIIVLPKNHYVVQKKMANVSIDMKRAMASCCQCEMCTDLCPRHLLGQPITPHLFMRAATSGVTSQVEPFLNTMFCSSCGLCEMYSCPQSLAPRTLIAKYKNGLRSKGIGVPKGIPLRDVDPMREYRAVPMGRLIARLDLSRYDVDAPFTEMKAIPKQVRIKLSQHIGAKAVPVVAKGDIVQKDQMIAAAEEGKLSIPVHTGISGKVLEVNENYIIINSL